MHAVPTAVLLLVLAQSPALRAGSELRVSIQALEHKISAGDRPYFLLRITNQSKARVFIDQSDLIINTGYTYQDGDIDIPNLHGRPISASAHGGISPRRSNRLPGDGIIGVEPGQSFLMLVQAPPIKKPGKTLVHISVLLSAVQDLYLHGDNWPDWPDFDLKSELQVLVHPSTP